MTSSLTSSVTDVGVWILENKEQIEKAVEIVGQGCAILADTVGQLHPILGAVFRISAKLLSNPEGKEAKFLTKQFEKVNQTMEKLQGDLEETQRLIERSSLNIEYFKIYSQIIGQYEMFNYIFTAKPEFKKVKINEFLIYFEQYEREKNLKCLYNAITRDRILDKILTTEQRSRKAVEEFCASIKKVFLVGVVALMGYNALTEGPVKEDKMKKWHGRMEEVEKLMKAAVDKCVNEFAEQAREDLDKINYETMSPESLLDILVKKYYWVSWSVRVFIHEDWKLVKFFLGKQHHVSGVNYFEFLSKNKKKIVVSFTAKPKPLNMSLITDQIEKEKGDVESVAESLCKSHPKCLVHVVSRWYKVEEANNFNTDHYFKSDKKAHIFIYSE
ncbi:uncharacterized protein LOC128514395 [Clarias gariepinus]|uniref:uncharacterized protein LOC128514395 n=1 Tax=Clarias gariepinus TaxID=13013 RepID=UPI00234C4AEE|nr:uncharacterized protein LOC128514395 [Clarias gariepinus]